MWVLPCVTLLLRLSFTSVSLWFRLQPIVSELTWGCLGFSVPGRLTTADHDSLLLYAMTLNRFWKGLLSVMYRTSVALSEVDCSPYQGQSELVAASPDD